MSNVIQIFINKIKPIKDYLNDKVKIKKKYVIAIILFSISIILFFICAKKLLIIITIIHI